LRPIGSKGGPGFGGSLKCRERNGSLLGGRGDFLLKERARGVLFRTREKGGQRVASTQRKKSMGVSTILRKTDAN